MTREEIAERAGVSLRTFDNYFAGKYEALAYRQIERFRTAAWPCCGASGRRAAVDGDHRVGVRTAGGRGPRGAVADPQQLSEVRKLMLAPQVREAISRELFAEWVAVIAGRLGADPERDLYPRMVAAVSRAITEAAARGLRAGRSARTHHRPDAPRVRRGGRRARWPVTEVTPVAAAPVVISGAGPNGLMVACELALAGIRPVVLDVLPGPSPEPKANGLVGQVVRLLDLRGLYQRFAGADGRPQPTPAWIFSGMVVPLTELADNPMYTMMISQPRLVALLHERARELGVQVRWGHELTGLARTGDGIEITVAGPDGEYRLRTEHLVGADGGRSPVRKAAGFEFPGTTSPTVARLAHVSIPDRLRGPDGGLAVPGFGRVAFGHNRFDRGGVIYAELEPGRPMLGTIEFGLDDSADDGEMSLEELRASARRVLGVDLPFDPPAGDGPHALRRIAGQHTRQADRYLDGNVYLLGDSAHVHSAMGGPGLNLGLADALNLGWKLAAEINGLGARRAAGDLPERALPGRAAGDDAFDGADRADGSRPRGRRAADVVRGIAAAAGGRCTHGGPAGRLRRGL